MYLKNKDQILRKTRNQKALSGETAPPPQPPPPPPDGGRPRLARSAKAKAGRRSKSVPGEVDQEDVFHDEEEEDIGKTLHSKDGRLGFVTNKGFIAATNFLVDIGSQVYSEKYCIKGNEINYGQMLPGQMTP